MARGARPSRTWQAGQTTTTAQPFPAIAPGSAYGTFWRRQTATPSRIITPPSTPSGGGTNTPPTFPATADLVNGTGTRSFTAVTTQAGDWVVVEVMYETSAGSTPTLSPLTWTGQTDTGTAGGAGDSRVVQYTAQDTTGGSRTIQVVPGTTANYRARLTVVRGSGGPGTGTGVTANGQTVSVTRQADNSAMFMGMCDWGAGAVGSPVWTPGGATLASEVVPSVATYVFGRWDDSGTAGTAAHGITSPSYTGPSIAVLEMLGTAGGGPASVTLTPATASFSAPSTTPVPQPVTVAVAAATATFTAQPVTPVPQPVTVALTPATSTFSAQPVTPVPGPVSTTITPATGTWAAQPVTPSGTGAASVTLTAATASFTAPAVTGVPQPVTTALTPAQAVFSARPVVPSAWLQLTPATSTFTAQSVTAVPGVVTTTVTPAAAAFSAPAVSPSGTGPGPGLVTLTPATAVFSARPVTATPGPVTVGLVPATASFSSRPVTAQPGPVSTTLVPALATFLAPAVVPDSAATKPLAHMSEVDRQPTRTSGTDRPAVTMYTMPSAQPALVGTDRPAAQMEA